MLEWKAGLCAGLRNVPASGIDGDVKQGSHHLTDGLDVAAVGDIKVNGRNKGHAPALALQDIDDGMVATILDDTIHDKDAAQLVIIDEVSGTI